MTVKEENQCYFCNDSINEINLTESNRHFPLQRVKEHNLDEAITLSKVAWENFPLLRESADTKKIVETVLEGIQQNINNQIFAPLNENINALNTLTATLQNNPKQIQESSKQTTQSLKESIKQIIFSINNGPTVQIRQIQEMISQLVYKPNVKGSVGETVFADIWPQFYRFDFVERLGGSGREDFIVTPYLNSGVSRHGERISIEGRVENRNTLEHTLMRQLNMRLQEDYHIVSSFMTRKRTFLNRQFLRGKTEFWLQLPIYSLEHGKWCGICLKYYRKNLPS